MNIYTFSNYFIRINNYYFLSIFLNVQMQSELKKTLIDEAITTSIRKNI